jgi:pentatricopeptide repeat protein
MPCEQCAADTDVAALSGYPFALCRGLEPAPTAPGVRTTHALPNLSADRTDWPLLVVVREGGISREQLTVEAYNALIGALGRCGLLEDAEALLERMQWTGVEPNTVTYAVHAHALCKAGEWQRASDAMAAMEAKGLPLDVRLYTSLVYGSAKAGEWDAADAAMEAMEMAGFTPDVHTYTALIGQLAKGASRLAHLKSQ